MKRVLALLGALFLLGAPAFLLPGCGEGGAASASEAPRMWEGEHREAVQSDEMQFQPPNAGAALVTLHTDKGDIQAVLYPDEAPLAVENFLTLAERGYYNGTEFHRVVRDFVVQGGDATGTGLGGESIWGIPFGNEYSNRLHHYAGALAMACAPENTQSNLSQFYIVAAPPGGFDAAALEKMRAAGMAEGVVEAYRLAGGLPYLDYTATVFGQVFAGMDVVDAIARVGVDDTGRPKSPVRIQSVTVQRPTAFFESETPAPAPLAPAGNAPETADAPAQSEAAPPGEVAG